MADSAKSKFENINELIKTLSWPLLVFMIFLFYKNELNQIMKLIPKKFENSSKITVGSVSFEIEKIANEAGDHNLGIVIQKLSKEAIKELITFEPRLRYRFIKESTFIGDENGDTTKYYTIPEELEIFKELEKYNLVEFENGETISEILDFYYDQKPTETTKYRDANGVVSDQKDDDHIYDFLETKLLVKQMKTDKYEKINSFYFRLTDKGMTSIDIILQVIVEQIKREKAN